MAAIMLKYIQKRRSSGRKEHIKEMKIRLGLIESVHVQ